MLQVPVAALLAVTSVAGIGVGNALTLPAARHVVRLDPQDGNPATWLLALQQDGAGGHWLGWWRSTDEAQTWSWYAPIQDTSLDRDTGDAVAVGMDVALVYSYEGPTIAGSTAHDVYFQWWRWNGHADWIPQTAVKVFDSTSSTTAYLRAELARDSLGRLWIFAQRLNSDGTFNMVMAVSTDGGVTFAEQPSLDNFAGRPGGRIMPVGGNRLMLLYGAQGGSPGYMRLRSDSDALGSWSARQVVFSEGIYHGAAMSAAGDGQGGVHLVYKDIAQQLYYRHWDGSWSAAQLIESTADWALQPAVARVGGEVFIFWNRALATNTDYQFYYRVLGNGSLGAPQLLDGSGGFKGYPAAPEVLPDAAAQVPCFYGDTPDANSSGSLALVFAPVPNAPPPPPPPSDAGAPDAGAPDAGAPDGGGVGSSVLFFDNFNRTISSGLGSSWTVLAGAWRDDSKEANSDLDALDRAEVAGIVCADCRIDAQMVNFAGGESMLELRGSGSSRYALALRADGVVELRRYSGGSVTVLAGAASGIADLTGWSSFSFVAEGAGPVSLSGYVNGKLKVSAADSSSAALTAAGAAGIAATWAGIWFDNFTLTGGASSPPPPPPPDGGTPDAGAPDAGAPDGGGVGSGVLFFDNFNRTVSSGLGSSWTVLVGAWRDDSKEANSDLDALDRAEVAGIACADCRIDAQMVNFAGGESMLELRGSGSSRYALALRADGVVELRRYSGGGVTVLASAPSGIADLTGWSSFSFVVEGAAPVSLAGYVNGKLKLSATDSSSAALTAAGAAGIAATWAGIWFDNFTLTGGASSPPPPDGGPPDAGAPDAGAPDGGSGSDGGVIVSTTDWPLYRHDPSGTANSPDALTAAQAQNLKLAYTVSVSYGSAANPLVVGGTLYVVAGGGALMALDAATGQKLWSQPLGLSTKSSCVGWNQGPIGTPAVVGHSIYAVGGNGDVYAFDKDTGASEWTTSIADTAADLFLWSGAFPVGSRVFVGVATLEEANCGEQPGRVAALDTATGAVVGTWWTDPVNHSGGGVWTTPAYDATTGRLFLTTGNPAAGVNATSVPYEQAFVAIDPSTMQTLDSYQPVTSGFSTDADFGASPTLFDTADGRHLIAATNKNGYVYALDRDDLAAGVLWKTQIAAGGASPDVGETSIVSAAFAGGTLFVGGGATPDGFPGTIAALNPATGAFLWKIHPDGFVLPALATVGGVVLAGVSHTSDAAGELWVVDQSNGAVLFKQATPGHIYAAPTWSNGMLYVVDAAGTLFALHP